MWTWLVGFVTGLIVKMMCSSVCDEATYKDNIAESGILSMA